ncbi:hypothetical protein DVB69_10935 [Sporosarcina sp. BI001-red]|nr:hypothetical protein DVB69_10935 [Sporosarcina sp. BI001-red]
MGRGKIVKKRLRMKTVKKYRGELIWAIYDGQLEKVKRIIQLEIDIIKLRMMDVHLSTGRYRKVIWISCNY